jgi:hypothetical protein
MIDSQARPIFKRAIAGTVLIATEMPLFFPQFSLFIETRWLHSRIFLWWTSTGPLSCDIFYLRYDYLLKDPSMRLRNLVVAACVIAGIAGSSSAVTLTYGAQDYEITTISGTFDALGTTLMDQAWWGDIGLSGELAKLLGTTLGLPNSSLGAVSGPAFAFEEYTSGGVQKNYSARIFSGNLNYFGRSNTEQEVWAVAVAPTVPAVPLPAGGLLLLSGLAGVAALKRRKKLTA